jgi:hypothetical protein
MYKLETTNSNKLETTNSNKLETTNSNKLETTNSNKLETTNSNKLEIINMNEFTDANVQKIINKIDLNEIKSFDELNNIVNEKAYATYNNKVVSELDINSKEFKKLNKESLFEISDITKDILPSTCKINSDEININMTKIENEEKLNELINLINHKFNIINKIL